MPVEIMQDDEPGQSPNLLVHQGCDAFAAEETVIVENDDTTVADSGPGPVKYFFCRLVDIYVNVAETESGALGNQVCRGIGENALKNAGIVDAERTEQFFHQVP